MTSVTFYDILGVSEMPDPESAAAALWPSDRVQGSVGRREIADTDEAVLQVGQLQAALTFSDLRPGAEATRVGLIADLHVGAVPPDLPLVLTALPDIAFHLVPTATASARIAVTAGDLGTELVIEGLPVEIKLPVGLLGPLEEDPDDDPPPEVTQEDSFVAGETDTLRIVLRSVAPSSIFVHVKLRMTEDGRVVIEPAVPLSIGPCRFSGLPCSGIYDLGLFPAPRLGIGADDEAHFGDQALEWTRHPILGDGDSDYGVVTVRTVDIDVTRTPFSYLRDAVNPDNVAEREFEIVLEDLAFPIGRPVPLPTHFLAGLRRQLGATDDPNGAFDTGGLAIPLAGAAKVLGYKFLLIEKLLFRSLADGDFHATEGDRQMAFLRLALTDDPAGAPVGPVIELAEDWTIIAGYRNDPLFPIFRLFTAEFSALGIRLGLSVGRLIDGANVFEAGLLVGDVQVLLSGEADTAREREGAFAFGNDGKAAKGVVINDFGLRFGEFSAGSFWKIEGSSLKAFDLVTLQIDEFGLVTEPSGAVYFGFSGSIPMPLGRERFPEEDDKVKTGPGPGGIDRKDGVGFRFHRLRGKVQGPEEAPFVLLDGVGIDVRLGDFGVSGFGSVTETIRDGHRYKEAGLSIRLDFTLGDTHLDLGGAFFYGKVSGARDNFSYGMAGLSVSPIPIGALVLSDVRLLFAWNMTPDLGAEPAGSATTMRLYQWYEGHRNGVDLPEGRNLGLTGWTAQDDAWTVAFGAGLHVSKAITLDGFFLYSSAEEGRRLLAGLKIFLLRSVAKTGSAPQVKSGNPIGYAVFEIDGERWSVNAGISIGAANVLGRPVPFLDDAPFLSGSFYHTNLPSTTAIGHFADPATWLGIHVGAGIGKKHDLFTIEAFAGLCLEIVDLPEGPRVFAARLSVSGGSKLFKVGGIDFYLTLQVTVGTWRTESRVSGFVAFLEGSINFHVFYVLNFGCTAKVQVDYLGPDPTFRRYFFEIRIDTPWWLPDASFRWDRVTGEAQPSRLDVLTTPLVSATAHQLAKPEPVVLAAISPVSGSDLRPDTVYSITDLSAATGAIPQAALDAIAPVDMDSTLALVFNASVDDLLVFGQNTTPDFGADKSGDVSSRYELVEFGIRRRRRGATDWSFLVDPSESRIETLDALSPAEAAMRMRQRVRMRWDADYQREGRPDARRLLVNSDAPYLTATANFAVDEALVRNDPGWPCCAPESAPPTWHNLDFRDVRSGARVAPIQVFTESASTLNWMLQPPIAGPGRDAVGEPRVARVNADVTPAGTFARMSLDAPARIFELRMVWRDFHLRRELVLRFYRGLEQIDERRFDLRQGVQGPMGFEFPEGLTEVELALAGDPEASTQLEFGWIEWVSARYRTVRAARLEALRAARCETGEDGNTRPGGRFAWLPGHDYEILLKTRVTVEQDGVGALVHEVPQTLRFATKGLPGTNLPDRESAEFAPLVEARYPSGGPLYREEAVLLALGEHSDMFRAPQPPRPEDPPERRQDVDWALVVHRIGGPGPAERISLPGEDWVVANRVDPPPPGPIRNPIDIGQVASTLARSARSLDPLRQRYELVRASPFGCDSPPQETPSRVLRHAPHDPEPRAPEGRWPARAMLRASVQIRSPAADGPATFVARERFVLGDEKAFATTDGDWDLAGGALGPAADTGTALSLARFGENGWRNFRASAAIVADTGSLAGIALALRDVPIGRDAVVFVIDETTRTLVAIRIERGAEQVLGSVRLPDGTVPPIRLDVAAYHDAFFASVGTARLIVPRRPSDIGCPALAVRGTARFANLLVDPLDLYSFDFETSRFADFIGHVGSWSGRVDHLPQMQPGPRPLSDMLADTPLDALMRRGASRADRQRAFDTWSAELGLLLRADVQRLEIGRSGPNGAAAFLVLESPEPLPLSEDVTLRLESGGAAIPLAVLSDGAERRAFVVPLDASGAPRTLLPGAYALHWRLERERFRGTASDDDRRFRQETESLLTIP